MELSRRTRRSRRRLSSTTFAFSLRNWPTDARAPFHFFLRGIALEDLWHDKDACQVKQSIAKADRVPGTDHIRKHCPFCVILNQARPLPSPAAG